MYLLKTCLSNLHVPSPREPIGREKNKSVYIQIMLALSSPQFKQTGKIPSLPEKVFWLISWAVEHLLNQIFVRKALLVVIRAFYCRRALPCLGYCLLLCLNVEKSHTKIEIHSLWSPPSRSLNIPCGAGRGESFLLCSAQTCAIAPSPASISPSLPLAWWDQDFLPQRLFH